MKQKIIVGIIILIVIIAGGIYFLARQRTTSGLNIQGGSELPARNPFEKGINPFDEYKNPFDFSTSLGARFQFAQVLLPSVAFPIAALGNCVSEAAGRAYCNNMVNITVCLDFAEAHELLPRAEIEKGRRFAQAGGKGPGGCTDRIACESYCNNLVHIEECVMFAEKTGVLAPEELREVKNIARYIREGGTMPAGCINKDSCMAYCHEPENMRECLDFAEKAHLISPQELAEAHKVLPFMERGDTPGGCTSKEECDAYCMRGIIEHMEECLAFAEKAGLIPEEELAIAKKVVPLMVRGETPGQCTSKEECEAYCARAANWKECLAFAEKIGLFSKAELLLLKQAIKLMPK